MKMDKIKELSQEELIQKKASLKEELFNLKFQFATGQLDNIMRVTQVKRDIARVLTMINENKKKAKSNK